MSAVTNAVTRWWLTWAWLLLGGVCMALGHGRWAVPVAAFLAPIFLIRFMRAAPIALAIPGFVLAHTLAWEVAYLGTVPMPAAARVGLFTGLSLVLSLVFCLDRLVARRSDRFAGTLVFPCGWVAFEFANGALSPSGTWGSIAYTFSDLPTLVQVASITGWTGLTFLAGWIGSTVNWVWERGLAEGRIRTGLAITGGVVLAVLFFGGARLAWSPPPAETVRVACVVAPGTFQGPAFNELWAYTRGVEIPEEDVQAARAQIERSRHAHFDLVEREIAAGARLVAWAEANAVVTEREEPQWIAHAQTLAARDAVYVGLGMSVFRPQSGAPSENKLILAGPEGTTAFEFLKATRVPGSSHVVGDGVLPLVETGLGTLSAAICFDLDFPRLIRQAGWHDADLLLAPSNDWEEVRGIHARMAIMRSVEQGFSLVRPTKDGISVVTDPLGRVLASLDTFTAEDKVLVAHVPTAGTVTVYSRIGDAFSWTCCVALVGLPVLLLRQPGSV